MHIKVVATRVARVKPRSRLAWKKKKMLRFIKRYKRVMRASLAENSARRAFNAEYRGAIADRAV